MIRVNQERRRATASDLRRVIEPLASYICATDQPKAVLNLAFSVLFHEVAQVHRAAKAQVAIFTRASSKNVSGPVDLPRGPGQVSFGR